jgi:hypothetical protein
MNAAGRRHRREAPAVDPAQSVTFFCRTHRCQPGSETARIEWRYLD